MMPRFHRIALLAAGLLPLPAAAIAQGMPQLDFKSPLTTAQVVWGALIFIVLYILMSRSALPRVGSVLEERASHIARDLQSAQSAKASADADMVEAEAATAKARSEAQAAITAALDEAKQAAAAQAVELNSRLEKQLQDAEAQIAAARAAAMRALRQVATDTAETVVSRLTNTPTDRRRLNRAIGAALAARGIS